MFSMHDNVKLPQRVMPSRQSRLMELGRMQKQVKASKLAYAS